jgi:acetyltransferase-like isoleucine patch superfamily enzyme
MGAGRIEFGRGVTIGWHLHPGYFQGCTWIEARNEDSLVAIGGGTHLNNDVHILSAGPGVRVGERCFIGAQVEIRDTDGHPTDPDTRREGQPKMGAVTIGGNVFVGSRVIILKGVEIGDGSVIGAGSVVSASLPSRVVAAGNPARVIRSL